MNEWYKNENRVDWTATSTFHYDWLSYSLSNND